MNKFVVMISTVLSTAAMAYFATPAMAVDLGASITGAYSGIMNGDGHGKFPGKDDKVMGGYKLGVNLVADTILDKNQLMNLRISVGYINGMITGTMPKNIDFFSAHSLHRIMWTNTLGFGLIKKDNFRFWIGPQLAMSFDFQKNGMRPGRKSDGFHKSLFGYLGFVAGANYSPVENFYLTAEIGARGGYGGSLETSKLRMKEIEPFVNLGFLYRVGSSGKSTVE